MGKRIAATIGALAAVCAFGVTNAQASATTSTDGRTAAHTATRIHAEDPPAGYSYEGTFYWHASCEEAGKGGIPRAWSAYVCLGDGMPWDSYDLYVKYN
ncbi:hypothetical protein GCM10009839_37460 [Catenulispora yoronensis]|uniref:Uncharacterized protein n=1 Tax=Catenulispora yoronensis TaxID=450799 RepID=A0ABP5FT86_9ACTN